MVTALRYVTFGPRHGGHIALPETREFICMVAAHLRDAAQFCKTASNFVGGAFPNNYTVFDTETSGIDFAKDLILECGWCTTRGGQPESNSAVVLDWTRVDAIDQTWLQLRLAQLKRFVEFDRYGQPTGRTCHFNYDRLRDEGEDPFEVLSTYVGLIQDAMQRNEALAGHNAWWFDRQMIDGNLRRFMPERAINWGLNAIIDTGLIEKAMQINAPPWPGDNLQSWYQRVYQTRTRAAWRLDGHCVPKYDLAARYNLTMDKAHTSDFDCLLVHYLIQTYRELAET